MLCPRARLTYRFAPVDMGDESIPIASVSGPRGRRRQLCPRYLDDTAANHSMSVPWWCNPRRVRDSCSAVIPSRGFLIYSYRPEPSGLAVAWSTRPML